MQLPGSGKDASRLVYVLCRSPSYPAVMQTTSCAAAEPVTPTFASRSAAAPAVSSPTLTAAPPPSEAAAAAQAPEASQAAAPSPTVAVPIPAPAPNAILWASSTPRTIVTATAAAALRAATSVAAEPVASGSRAAAQPGSPLTLPAAGVAVSPLTAAGCRHTGRLCLRSVD